jgi:hypothetical protein
MSSFRNPLGKMTAATQAGLYYARRRRRARAAVQALTPWSASLSVTDGQYFQSEGNAYRALGTGTTGSTAPAGYGQASDGTINWQFVDPQTFGRLPL